MRIFILGGTQFIGPHVVRLLHKGGHQIAVFHRGRTSTPLPEGVTEFLGDRAQLKEKAAELRAWSPDIVLDMIPRTAQDAWDMINTFRCPQRRLVAISSADVYRNFGRLIGRESGRADPTPLVETAPLRHILFPYRTGQPSEESPSWLPDYDKILVEKLILSEPEMPGTVLRLPMVYGPNDVQHRLYPYLKRMLDKRPAILLEEKQSSWRTARSYSVNVAAAIVLAVTDSRAAGRIYNVAGPRAFTEAEWVRSIAQVVGWNGQIVIKKMDEMPSHLQDHSDWTQHLALDTTRIRAELGYLEPVSREEAMLRTIEWESANPPHTSTDEFNYEREDEALRGS